ncbi:class I SAM-dependent RNA methyltransferase, partial [Nocardioides sp.]|uniref:class I SAM-dependent RNA methyltransferase n=1 Tax=Nocardioides sp. TaxID=35761 RepID=UPI0027328BD9
VREQLVRLGRLPAEDPLVAGLRVEAVPGDQQGLRWRTRMEYAVDAAGRVGLRRHRSREVEPVDDCRIAHPEAVVRGADGPAVEEGVRLASGVARSYAVDPDGFWQAHPGAPRALVETVLELLDPQPGERALDLYAGVGLFAGFLGERVGEQGSVIAAESSRSAAAHAVANLSDLPCARVEVGSVDRVLERLDCPPADVVVLDPPREGAKRGVVEQVVSCAPRAVAYVACDPAALARDVAIFAEHGYRLTGLRAFDMFPMTHHVECVALLETTSPDLQ